MRSQTAGNEGRIWVGSDIRSCYCASPWALGVAGAGTAAADPTPRTTFYGGLDAAEVSLAWSALQETLETRMSREVGTWRNAATGNTGSITPLRTYRIEIGTYCRDYRETVARGGQLAHGFR